MSAVPPPARRTDPERRDRIIDAALEVIARDGVAGTSHRRVAAAADVPLGSMTYHFTGMDELLDEAFTRFADRAADGFADRFGAATSREEAVEAVVALLEQDPLADAHDLVLTHELYTLAARDPRYRRITEHWLERNHTTLTRHFDPTTARIVDALIEGVTLHRALGAPRSRTTEAVEAVRRATRAG
ncbi:TetR family transcriptional regulator [Amnibacterium sp. CER49]|uniref:TetR/AcrR family transcriptional regulator n=1 Tax=Amnibacterium sp. CER49 TaxID=3039161 RepID=UPI00244D2E1B|nr:TetR family transcriptional regulator [Amnibacterium sp. CER49]MDH2444900.1 TetR family transcriptional regulator [Amnibacterium sp. CER49]